MADAFGATMAMLLFVTLLVGGGIYYIVHLKRRKDDLEETLESQKNAANLHTIIYSTIKDIAELTTVREEFTAEITYENVKEKFGFKLPLTGVKFQMTYSGVIKCGCDLTRAIIPENGINGNSATIILPQCTIVDFHSTPGSYKIISNESGVFADKITLEQQQALVDSDLEREKNHLISEGILQRANENVCRILKAQMQAIGINPNVVFLNSDDTSRINAAPDTRLLN